MAGDVLYDDGGLLVDRRGVTIRRYYFPWGGSKRIEFPDIRGVEALPMTWRTGKGRAWGTADPRYWLPLDVGRHRKEVLLVLDLGRGVSPAVTPDDPELVADLIRTHAGPGLSGRGAV